MEKEKIDLARKQLEEDREKFEKMMNDSEKNVKRTEDEVKSAINVKMRLIKRIEELNNKIGVKDGTIKKVEEDLIDCKVNKHFLDILSMEAGRKKYQQKAPVEVDTDS